MKTRIRMLLVIALVLSALSLIRLSNATAVAEDPNRAAVPEEESSPESLEYLTSIEEVKRLREKANIAKSDPLTVEERLRKYHEDLERQREEMLAERDRERAELGLIVLEDGSVLYMSLDDIREHIYQFVTEYEVDQTALMVDGEIGGINSKTLWSATVWSGIVNRLGKPGFSGSDSILGLLYSGAFTAVTVHTWKMERPVRPEIKDVVIDVYARMIYESMGAPPELVGRTVPENYCYFRNEGYRDVVNHFYDDWQGGNEYDPFSAPYNPYDT